MSTLTCLRLGNISEKALPTRLGASREQFKNRPALPKCLGGGSDRPGATSLAHHVFDRGLYVGFGRGPALGRHGFCLS